MGTEVGDYVGLHQFSINLEKSFSLICVTRVKANYRPVEAMSKLDSFCSLCYQTHSLLFDNIIVMCSTTI